MVLCFSSLFSSFCCWCFALISTLHYSQLLLLQPLLFFVVSLEEFQRLCKKSNEYVLILRNRNQNKWMPFWCVWNYRWQTFVYVVQQSGHRLFSPFFDQQPFFGSFDGLNLFGYHLWREEWRKNFIKNENS